MHFHTRASILAVNRVRDLSEATFTGPCNITSACMHMLLAGHAAQRLHWTPVRRRKVHAFRMQHGTAADSTPSSGIGTLAAGTQTMPDVHATVRHGQLGNAFVVS